MASGGEAPRIAVVGAGISGLTAARILHGQGLQIQVFEKARGRGGRAATRRVGPLRFDHGAQYFTARDPDFRDQVTAWRKRALVDIWPSRVGRVVAGTIQPSPDTQERFVAVPGMSMLGRHLAADLALRTEVRVAPPARAAGRWCLTSEAGEALGTFDALIVSAPAPQACALLETNAPRLAAQAAAIQYKPTWAVMLAFEHRERLTSNALFFENAPLRWAAEDSSKPGRQGHNWVLHASPDWSRDHLDDAPEQVAHELAISFCDVTRLSPDTIAFQSAHRWLYSLATNPLDVGALWDRDLRVGMCGDWCHGARIEGAYLSGRAVAGRVLRDLTRTGIGDAGSEKL